MSFWKTLVLEVSYEWLVHAIEPQVGKALRDRLQTGPFYRWENQGPGRGDDFPQLYGKE